MIIGICPKTLNASLQTVKVSTPGTLLDKLGGETASKKICRLKITGNLNKNDIKVLKEMSDITTGQLSYLDMSECAVENNTISERAFSGCYTLQEIILPNGVTTIEEAAFENCLGLWSVVLPTKLSYIARYAFHNCRYIEKIVLPATLKSIDNNPFTRAKIDVIEIENGNNYFKICDGAILSKDNKVLYSMPVKCKGKYKVPEGVERIGRDAFSLCYMIESISLPSTLTTVSDAGLGCPFLKEIYCYAVIPPSNFGRPCLPNLPSCILHVPQGCKEAYNKIYSTYYRQIIDDLPNTSSVINIHEEKGNPHQIYSVSGQRRAIMEKGINIVGGKKVIAK